MLMGGESEECKMLESGRGVWKLEETADTAGETKEVPKGWIVKEAVEEGTAERAAEGVAKGAAEGVAKGAAEGECEGEAEEAVEGANEGVLTPKGVTG
jgi:hypothetical protein